MYQCDIRRVTPAIFARWLVSFVIDHGWAVEDPSAGKLSVLNADAYGPGPDGVRVKFQYSPPYPLDRPVAYDVAGGAKVIYRIDFRLIPLDAERTEITATSHDDTTDYLRLLLSAIDARWPSLATSDNPTWPPGAPRDEYETYRLTTLDQQSEVRISGTAEVVSNWILSQMNAVRPGTVEIHEEEFSGLVGTTIARPTLAFPHYSVIGWAQLLNYSGKESHYWERLGLVESEFATYPLAVRIDIREIPRGAQVILKSITEYGFYTAYLSKELLKVFDLIETGAPVGANPQPVKQAKFSPLGRRPKTDAEKLAAVNTWDNLPKDDRPPLADWLSTYFGDNPAGPNVAEPTFHGWRRRLKKS